MGSAWRSPPWDEQEQLVPGQFPSQQSMSEPLRLSKCPLSWKTHSLYELSLLPSSSPNSQSH